jgi:hypothetical protein
MGVNFLSLTTGQRKDALDRYHQNPGMGMIATLGQFTVQKNETEKQDPLKEPLHSALKTDDGAIIG